MVKNMSSFSVLVFLQDYSVRGGKGDFIIAWFWTMEFTNPFLSMAIILKIVSVQPPKNFHTVQRCLHLLKFEPATLLRNLRHIDSALDTQGLLSQAVPCVMAEEVNRAVQKAEARNRASFSRQTRKSLKYPFDSWISTVTILSLAQQLTPVLASQMSLQTWQPVAQSRIPDPTNPRVDNFQ